MLVGYILTYIWVHFDLKYWVHFDLLPEEWQ